MTGKVTSNWLTLVLPFKQKEKFQRWLELDITWPQVLLIKDTVKSVIFGLLESPYTT